MFRRLKLPIHFWKILEGRFGYALLFTVKKGGKVKDGSNGVPSRQRFAVYPSEMYCSVVNVERPADSI